MKPKPKKAKKPPSPKRAAERVFSATFDANGKLIAVSYRGAVPEDKLKRPHVGNLVRLMVVVGKALAESSGGNKPDAVSFERDDDGKKFHDAVLKNPARCAWFKTLFDIKNLSDSPFKSAWQDFGISLTHKNAPAVVRITIDGKTIDSTNSEPSEFVVPKSATQTAASGNYAAALGKVVVKAAADFNRHLSLYRHREDGPFDYAQQILNEITSAAESTSIEMNMMSLIPPSAWYQVGDWTAHHGRVRELAENAGKNNLDLWQRRIHSVDVALLEKSVELVLLTDLLLYDLRHRIESRVLSVKKDKVVSPEGIPSVDGVLLMDYGIFSTGKGLYRVIISDIQPFGETASESFQFSPFPELDLQALYYFMQHNWHNAWWGKAKGTEVIYTVDVLHRVLKFPDDTKLTGMPLLWFFKNLNSAEGGVFRAVKDAVVRLMKEANVGRGKQDELKFRKWFEKHGKDFRDSLKAKGIK